MPLSVCSLNSGSNGNCYYIGNEHDAVLIDAGISRRETEKRMLRLGLSFKKIKAIFITHEHSDHINGITSLLKKHELPLYITRNTMLQGRLLVREKLINAFRPYEPVIIGSLAITAFPKFHDACDPHSFTVEGNGVKIGVFTDIGASCDHVTRNFAQCHAAFLESNYDEEMLERGKYPIFLKNRIRNGLGHLSNRQAAQLFVDHRPPFMSHLFLSHLSRVNNCPKIVKELFTKIAGTTEIVIASRDQETDVYSIYNTHQPLRVKSLQTQLSLF